MGVIDELIDLDENYSRSDELSNYQGNLQVPYNGFDGRCHTLESVKVEYVDKNREVFDVEY